MTARPDNAFLRGLDREAWAALAEQLTVVDLVAGDLMHQAEDRVDSVWFPETCLLSVLTAAEQGETVETAMVGNEGGLGVLEACGSGRSHATSMVQIAGRAWKAPASAVRTLVLSHPGFAASAWKLVELQMGESRQSGLCQAVHAVEPRMARWLLECSERTGERKVLALTQEFIAAMLGVQRTTVTAFAGQLQKAGLLQYSRGRVEIIDPSGLAQRACECRGATREQRRRLQLEPVRVGATVD